MGKEKPPDDTGEDTEKSEATPENQEADTDKARASTEVQAEGLREQASNILKNEKPTNSAESIKRFRFEIQYDDRLETLEFFGLIDHNKKSKEGDAPFPDFYNVMKSFSEQELKFASEFQCPTLLLIPLTKFRTIQMSIDALDPVKKNVQRNFKRDRIVGWLAVIVEGAQEMRRKADDNTYADLSKRLRIRRLERKEFDKGMDKFIGVGCNFF